MDHRLKGIADLSSLVEDKRLQVIADWCRANREEIAGVAIEDQAKADRYIEKMATLHPYIKVLDTRPGPAGTILVRMQMKAD